jgi:hypothetical protein
LHVSNLSTLLFQLNTLAEEDFRVVFRTPVDSGKTEEAPEEEEEEEEPKKKNAHRPSKHPRGKSSGPDVGTGGEASAKKAKTAPSSGARHYDSKKAERGRIKMLATTGKGTPPILPGAT